MAELDLSKYGTVATPPSGGVDLSKYGEVSAPSANSNTPQRKESQLSQFGSTLGHDLMNLPSTLYQTVRHPIDTALAASAEQREKAKSDFAAGNYLDATTHAIGGYFPVPYLPPFLADTLTDIGSKENMGRGAARLAEMGVAPTVPKIIRSAAKMGVPELHPIVEHGLERTLHLPHGTISTLREAFGSGPAAGPLPGSGNEPGPYFNERSTIDPQMHGATPPAGPPTSTGTVHAPPVTPPEPAGVNTRSPAGRVNPTARPAGPPPTGTVNVPPLPQPDLGTQAQGARGPLVSPVATKPPSRVFVGSSGTIPGKVSTEASAAESAATDDVLEGIAKGMGGKKFANLSPEQQAAAQNLATRIRAQSQPAPTATEPNPKPEATVAPAQPSPNGTLKPPVTANTPEAYTKKSLDQIVKKAQPEAGLSKHQNEFHVGDVSEHKALNVARYLNEQGVSADAYQTILDTAKKTGDWSPVDRINNEAFKSGQAGAYPGYLPKNGYSTVSDARRVQRGSYQGTTTPQRIIEHLREYDKLRK